MYEVLRKEGFVVKCVTEWHWKVWAPKKTCFVNFYPSKQSFNMDNCQTIAKGFDRFLSYLKYGAVQTTDKDLIL